MLPVYEALQANIDRTVALRMIWPIMAAQLLQSLSCPGRLAPCQQHDGPERRAAPPGLTGIRPLAQSIAGCRTRFGHEG